MERDSNGRIELDIAVVWRGSDGVIRIDFKPSSKHDLEDARCIVSAHNRLAEGVPCPVLADITQVSVGADRAARQYYVSEESSRLKTGMAMVTQSPLQQMLGNFFFRMNRPPYPTRMFRETDAALAWLASL